MAILENHKIHEHLWKKNNSWVHDSLFYFQTNPYKSGNLHKNPLKLMVSEVPWRQETINRWPFTWAAANMT